MQTQRIDWNKVLPWRRPVCTAQVACDGNDIAPVRLSRGKMLCLPCEQTIARRARLKKEGVFIKGLKGRRSADERE